MNTFLHPKPLKVDPCDSSRAVFTIELYLRTERALTVGAETQDTQHDWILALTKVTPFEQSTPTHEAHISILFL